MSAMETILIVDDQPEILHSLERQLREQYRVLTALNGAAAIDLLRAHETAVILSDQRMPGMTGVEFLARSIEIRPDAVRILITAYADIQASIAAVNQGRIFYYISKPWEPEELDLIVKRAAEQYRLVMENKRLSAELREANRRLEDENRSLKKTLAAGVSLEEVIGNSPRMLRVKKLVSKILDTSTTVLLIGETGTGKEILARAIHSNGCRRDRPFVVQNCGAVPETLLESELFGHVKGSFTGAISDKTGIFELADKGTVFLDEVGDMSSAMQIRLLRVLQEGEIKPVGSAAVRHVDVRILAATHRNLEEEVRTGRFREDLFYRLNVYPVLLPPLRERPEDIQDLAAFFLEKYCSRLKKRMKGVSEEVIRLFRSHSWPGNIREMENEIERAVTLADQDAALTPDLLSPRFHKFTGGAESGTGTGSDLKAEVQGIEKRRILEILERNSGNISKTAAELGLSRQGLHKKLNRYGIQAKNL
ncbi:sigma-54-dependent Fis family transcriptional regulator [bacterium]|nr:sigma-54-dependent Fis family transcriptional regulator [bacterium]